MLLEVFRSALYPIRGILRKSPSLLGATNIQSYRGVPVNPNVHRKNVAKSHVVGSQPSIIGRSSSLLTR